MEMRQRNIITSIALLLIGVGYAIMTSKLPTRELENSTQPSFFPWIIAVCLLVLALSLLIQNLFQLGELQELGARVLTPIKVVWIAVFVGYFLILPKLGFVLANILLFAVFMYLYDERNPFKIALSSVLVPILIFFLFRDVFNIRLPAGVLGGWIQ